MKGIAKLFSCCIIAAIVFTTSIKGQTDAEETPRPTKRESPAEWDDLVFGGRFMDRFQALPNLGGMTSDTWGSASVLPRDIRNGIEDIDWSYWGGNTRKTHDGNYHLFVCRWPEDAPEGHMSWKNSTLIHAVSKHSFGPYKFVNEVGPGHDPEWYRASDGSYIVSVNSGYYISKNINGPYEFREFSFNNRDRSVTSEKSSIHELSFAKREDGSFIMVNSYGQIWFSKDGITEWERVSEESIFPLAESKYKDPVIWRTNIQYHLIVYDSLGRVARHFRSKEGLNWKADPGEAYMPGIAKQADGRTEDWFEFERIKILQDEYGRAFQANFAVIDTLKHQDLPNDRHSSKLLCVPLTKGILITILNKEPIKSYTSEIKIRVQGEEGFDPYIDLDMISLRFGAPEVVDFGKGCKLIKKERDGKDAIFIFNGFENGLSEENFTAKLIGKTRRGELVFGYSRLPWLNYLEPILSTEAPVFSKLKKGYVAEIIVDNFGQVASEASEIKIMIIENGIETEIASGFVPALKAFQQKKVKMECSRKFKKGVTYEVKTYLMHQGHDPVTFTKSILIRN